MGDAMGAETIRFVGHNGDELEGYRAQPLGGGPYGGVVVIHHMPGYDEATKEITRRFAAHGYLALCPNLYSREGFGVSPDDAAAAARAKGGVPDEQLVGDVAGAAAHLRSLPSSNGRVAPSATARAAASHSWPPAPSTSRRRSTATAPSSWGPCPRGFR